MKYDYVSLFLYFLYFTIANIKIIPILLNYFNMHDILYCIILNKIE